MSEVKSQKVIWVENSYVGANTLQSALDEGYSLQSLLVTHQNENGCMVVLQSSEVVNKSLNTLREEVVALREETKDLFDNSDEKDTKSAEEVVEAVKVEKKKRGRPKKVEEAKVEEVAAVEEPSNS